MSALLDVEGLGKQFGSTVALRDLGMSIAPGEIRALLGENGAGKSTFVKLLSGLVRPDHGRIRLQGDDYRPGSVTDAWSHGVATAFQELSLVPYHDVAENFFLAGVLDIGRVYRKRAARTGTRAILDAFGIDDVSPGDRVGGLSLAQQQRLEIVRALCRRPRLLVLDEPTAALPDPEWLYQYVERLASDGTAVLFISHRLAEVRRLCRTVTVLRGGESVYSDGLATATDDVLFEEMVGRQLGKTLKAAGERQREVASNEAPLLCVENFRVGLADVPRLEVAPGEIVGIAALEGQGQKDLFSGIAGVVRPDAGTIRIGGRLITGHGAGSRLRHGLVFVPEERKTEGILAGLSTEANISLSSLGAVTRVSGLVDARREREGVEHIARSVDIKPEYLDWPIERLSGGNQQKALLARTLMTRPRCMVLFDPTRGVDVGTKETMYEVMESFAGDGGGMLFYSTDLHELVRFAHRVLVMYRGRIVGEATGDEVRDEKLVRLMCGYTEESNGEVADVVGA